MAIEDFNIDWSTKTITHIGGRPGIWGVRGFYRELVDAGDEQTTGDIEDPLSADTPNAYSITSWTFDPEVFDYLDGGGTEKLGLGGSVGDAKVDGGSIEDTANGRLYANFATLGIIPSTVPVYIYQNGAEAAHNKGTGPIDTLIKVKEADALIDSGDIFVGCRPWGYLYGHQFISLSAGSRSYASLSIVEDRAITEDVATVDGWSDITFTFGPVSKDMNNGNGPQNYSVVVDCGGRRLSEVYHKLQAATRYNSPETLNGLPGEFYRAAPGVTVESQAAPFGSFSGGTLTGAPGVWFENYSALDANNIEMLTVEGTSQVPPRLVPIIVSGLLIGDLVIVSRTSSGSVVRDEYLASPASIGATSFSVKSQVQNFHPATGVVRVGDQALSYTSYSTDTNTFELESALAEEIADDAPVYIPFINKYATSDTAETLIQYTSNINVRVFVKRFEIGNTYKPYTVPGIVGSNGLTVQAVRTKDNVAS
jgi:hypothetical protein